MTAVGLIIQARMGSSRLPGKVLRLVGSMPLLGHVVGRLRDGTSGWPIVVATTALAQDDAIVAWCDAHHVSVFRDSALDVLRRYAMAASHYGFDHVVRLTADNPFTDIAELKRLVAMHLDSGFDYTHSFGELPLGVGGEIFTFDALQRSDRDGQAPNHREHVNEYIQERPESFRIGQLPVARAKHSPSLRLTVDTEEDWQRANALATHAAGRWLTTEEAIELCSRSA
jgi:spore coat polysaccharide biosynthesis protein SpsF